MLGKSTARMTLRRSDGPKGALRFSAMVWKCLVVCVCVYVSSTVWPVELNPGMLTEKAVCATITCDCNPSYHRV